VRLPLTVALTRNRLSRLRNRENKYRMKGQNIDNVVFAKLTENGNAV
jgi:hypothetical protein